MQKNEFKSVEAYIKELKEQMKDRKVRNKEFFSLMPLILEKHTGAEVRDFLEVDNTFGVVFKKGQGPAFIKAISLYEDLRDIITATTYSKVKNTGLIDLDDKEGFWILVK